MRTTATSAGSATEDLLMARHPTPHVIATFKTEYAAKLAAFELALRAAAAQSPVPMRAQLNEVAKQVAWGRTLVRDAPDVQTFTDSTIGSLWKGLSALEYADDLAGTGCGFRILSDRSLPVL